MADATIMAIDAGKLTEILQAMGFRAEAFEDANGAACLRSATSGVGFTIRFGNRALPPAEGFTDFTYIAVIKIMEGQFPLSRINEWNQVRRFCKLHTRDDFLVLDLDVLVAGGVTEAYVRQTVGLWDRLIQDLVMFLRGDSVADAGKAA
jgi:Putative bacterial sensory transduction regulator